MRTVSIPRFVLLWGACKTDELRTRTYSPNDYLQNDQPL